jgi:type IV secretory pathway component VirB8
MERTFRLEFNEKKQQFHLDNYTHEPNTFGWKTICEHITDKEWKFFNDHIKINKPKKYTVFYLRQKIEECKRLANILINNEIEL